jgi:CheY-like chemotaxis protein
MSTAEVLLVDDNPADSDLICEVLAQCRRPSHVTAVPDGVEAIKFLERQGNYGNARTPHMVLLDLNLPRKDGRAVLAAIKSNPALRKIPVVIFTTSQARQDVVCSYELGANCYVTKPGNLQDFVSALNALAEFWFGFSHLPQVNHE